jgi:hypothetical protein
VAAVTVDTVTGGNEEGEEVVVGGLHAVKQPSSSG